MAIAYYRRIQLWYHAEIQIRSVGNKNKWSGRPLVIQNKNNLNKFKFKKKTWWW